MKIALVENFGADFVGARLRFALYLRNKGVSVTAIIPNDGHKDIIEEKGIEVIEVGANIRGNGLANKIEYARKLKNMLIQQNFDIVHFYRLQPNLIGTLVSGLNTKSKIVNHITGLGVAFTERTLKNLVYQFLIKSLYRTNKFLFNPFTVFQNKEDIKELGYKSRTICIEGSAANQDLFYKGFSKEHKDEIEILKEELKINKNEKVFIFVSRLLKEKGVLELIEGTIEINKQLNTPVNLLVIGWSDVENPSAIKSSFLESYTKQYPFVKYLGKRSDVNKLLALSDVSILPTYYREGTPRFLLESMAMGKPIITTDMPGCNHLVPNDENGILIPPRDSKAITNAMLKILNEDLKTLGEKSNALYHEKFSEEKVYSAIYNLYVSILE
jgi:glycosyltransferase involved in cell wall biosynthesis